MYFKGNCYYKSGNDYKASREERIVGIKDVTGTGFVEVRHWWLKLLALLFTILTIIFVCITAEEESAAPIMILFGLITIAIILVYIFYKQRYFEIAYAGGTIAFKASNYNFSEMQEFQKTLHKAKDKYDMIK